MGCVEQGQGLGYIMPSKQDNDEACYGIVVGNHREWSKHVVDNEASRRRIIARLWISTNATTTT